MIYLRDVYGSPLGWYGYAKETYLREPCTQKRPIQETYEWKLDPSKRRMGWSSSMNNTYMQKGCMRVCRSELQYVAVSCSELQWVAVCQRCFVYVCLHFAWRHQRIHLHCSVLQCVAVCHSACSVWQCAAASCNDLQWVAASCSVSALPFLPVPALAKRPEWPHVVHTCDMTHWCDMMHVCDTIHMYDTTHMCDMTHTCHMTHVFGMTHTCAMTHMCAMTLICVTWLICVTQLMRDVTWHCTYTQIWTASYVTRLICVSWLICVTWPAMI